MPRLCTATVIAIGTEITTGAKLDTNSQWLSLELADRGISVVKHVTIADELDDMVRALGDAVSRTDLVVITGGLGPTLDDLTRDMVARVLGEPLELDAGVLDQIRALFERRRRTMPARNQVQAMFPRGSTVIPNPRGTAPGIWAEWREGQSGAPSRTSVIVALPGVPSEMKPMFNDWVAPRVAQAARQIRRARIHCFGGGESQIEAMLGDLTARGGDPDIGITAHDATITLRITAAGTDEAECRAKIDGARSEIRHRLGTFVFGEEDQELEHVVVELLRQRGLTLALYEMGTGGLMAQRLTLVPDVAGCFVGGTVATPHVGWTAEALLEQVQHVRESTGATFALGTSGWRRFAGEDTTQDVPTSHVALAWFGGHTTEELRHFGDEAIARSRTVKAAFNVLRLHLWRTKPVPPA